MWVAEENNIKALVAVVLNETTRSKPIMAENMPTPQKQAAVGRTRVKVEVKIEKGKTEARIEKPRAKVVVRRKKPKAKAEAKVEMGAKTKA